MRTLYLIRHAKSSWESPGVRDFDRPLNDRGLRDAPSMAKILVERHISPDLVVTSPAKRAQTTALFFARAFGISDEQVLRNPDIYDALPFTILQTISGLPDSARTVLMFGHNPSFTEVANHFTEDFIPNVPTCGIVQINTQAETWAEMTELNSKVVARFFPKEML